MTSPTPKYDSARLRELASSVMDGTASPAELQELTTLLRENETARDEYLAFVDLHAVLAYELSTTEPAPRVSKSKPRKTSRAWTIASVLVLSLLTVAAFTFLNQPDPQKQTQIVNDTEATDSDAEAFASIAQAVDVTWREAAFKNGDRLAAQTITFDSGVLHLLFDDGVEVTLEGPAKYQLLSPGKTKLHAGVLAANVPEGAEGFTVDTESAEVVDLGTSFGIDLSTDGTARVSVFDGEVEVAVGNRVTKQRLTEGESLKIGMDSEVEVVELDSTPFEKLWPIASGITGSTDTVKILPPGPRPIRDVRSDEHIFLALERRFVALSEDLAVNISEPGDYVQTDELTPQTLLSGKAIRSYTLHYAPEKPARPRRAVRWEGSITFDQPVLGIIVRHEELLDSSGQFSRRGMREKNPRRELRFSGGNDGDRITLSDDRRTIGLSLIAPGRSSDLVRVIVEGQRPGPRFRPRRPGRRTSNHRNRAQSHEGARP